MSVDERRPNLLARDTPLRAGTRPAAPDSLGSVRFRGGELAHGPH